MTSLWCFIARSRSKLLGIFVRCDNPSVHASLTARGNPNQRKPWLDPVLIVLTDLFKLYSDRLQDLGVPALEETCLEKWFISIRNLPLEWS